jgi:hypothetical protein
MQKWEYMVVEQILSPLGGVYIVKMGGKHKKQSGVDLGSEFGK